MTNLAQCSVKKLLRNCAFNSFKNYAHLIFKEIMKNKLAITPKVLSSKADHKRWTKLKELKFKDIHAPVFFTRSIRLHILFQQT